MEPAKQAAMDAYMGGQYKQLPEAERELMTPEEQAKYLGRLPETELDDLSKRVLDEQLSRRCQEFLSGHQSCDKGREPHDEHGYTVWRHDGRGRVRVTWKNIVPDPEG